MLKKPNLYVFIVLHVTSSTLETRYISTSSPFCSSLCSESLCPFSFTMLALQLTFSAKIPG